LRHDLASVALDKKDPEKAIRLLEPDVSRDDAFPESLAVYAKALFLVGRRAEAERARARMKASKIREAD
jgi:predicted Zn-dependent protease